MEVPFFDRNSMNAQDNRKEYLTGGGARVIDGLSVDLVIQGGGTAAERWAREGGKLSKVLVHISVFQSPLSMPSRMQ